jgi:hypothetical protein
VRRRTFLRAALGAAALAVAPLWGGPARAPRYATGGIVKAFPFSEMPPHHFNCRCVVVPKTKIEIRVADAESFCAHLEEHRETFAETVRQAVRRGRGYDWRAISAAKAPSPCPVIRG